ncbi:MAG: flagellar protein [FCB group bacterium]|nr:flagellar protein [FCB group bacterium]
MLRLRQLQQSQAIKPIPSVASPGTSGQTESSFAQMLESKISAPDVKFSAHAVSRLIDRNISLNQNEIDRLRTGVSKADAKGAKESLVLMEDKAFVVSVKNRTVITAITGEGLKENVFTNIDSAVIV